MIEEQSGLSHLAGLFKISELTQITLGLIDDPSDLAKLARVNREFYVIAQRALYRSLYLWCRESEL